MEPFYTFLLGVLITFLFLKRRVKLAAVMITTRLVSEDAPVLLSCKLNCIGITPIQEIEYAEDLDLDELEEHLAELDVAREVLKEYIEEIKYDEDDDDDSIY